MEAIFAIKLKKVGISNRALIVITNRNSSAFPRCPNTVASFIVTLLVFIFHFNKSCEGRKTTVVSLVPTRDGKMGEVGASL